MQWVLDSLRHQAVQAEEPYEVADNAKASVPGAPRRARLAMQDRSKVTSTQLSPFLCVGLGL